MWRPTWTWSTEIRTTWARPWTTTLAIPSWAVMPRTGARAIHWKVRIRSALCHTPITSPAICPRISSRPRLPRTTPSWHSPTPSWRWPGITHYCIKVSGRSIILSRSSWLDSWTMDRLSTGQMADKMIMATVLKSTVQIGMGLRGEENWAEPFILARHSEQIEWIQEWDGKSFLTDSLVESQVPEKRLMQLNLHRVRDEQRRRHLLQASTRSSSHTC